MKILDKLRIKYGKNCIILKNFLQMTNFLENFCRNFMQILQEHVKFIFLEFEFCMSIIVKKNKKNVFICRKYLH